MYRSSSILERIVTWDSDYSNSKDIPRQIEKASRTMAVFNT